MATNGGHPLGGVTADIDGRTTLSDDNGAFRFEWQRVASQLAVAGQLTLTSERNVPRTLTLNVNLSRDVVVDAIALDGGFDLEYYRRFVRNGFEEPGTLQPLRRWTSAPMIYLKTVDEAGEPIDPITLDTVSAALSSSAEAWTGGRFGLAGIERGTETRVGVTGWITVRWPNPAPDANCGRAQVGVDGGWIELHHLTRNCGCRGSRMRPCTAKHELGHAMGYWHTGHAGDVMVGGPVSVCDSQASDRERLHAAIAYSRPRGNVDPDTDLGQLFVRSLQPIVVP